VKRPARTNCPIGLRQIKARPELMTIVPPLGGEIVVGIS
jgi:hypothetical protein